MCSIVSTHPPNTPQVEEETTNKRGETTKVFVNTKLMTRQTYSLNDVEGDLTVRFVFLSFSFSFPFFLRFAFCYVLPSPFSAFCVSDLV